jgi:hypothetical protein
MEEKKVLSIGLVEADLEWLVLLQTLLTVAGHAVAVCRERGEKLRAWLATCCASPGPSSLPACDLLIVDIANGEMLADEAVYASLEQIFWQGTPPLIVLTAGTPLKLKLPGAAAVLPFRNVAQVIVLFQLIEGLTGVPSPLSLPFLLQAQYRLREQAWETLTAEQAWLDQRRAWLDQRYEWIEQRQVWLDQRRAWLDRLRTEPACQREWLEEQYAWLEQQEREVSLQRRQINDLEHWLRRSQRELDQQRQQHLREAR